MSPRVILLIILCIIISISLTIITYYYFTGGIKRAEPLLKSDKKPFPVEMKWTPCITQEMAKDAGYEWRDPAALDSCIAAGFEKWVEASTNGCPIIEGDAPHKFRCA